MREHGSRAKYVAERCRCDSCRKANATYQRDRDRHTRRVSHGIEEHRPAFIDATETREHLQWLRRQNIGKRRIAELTGLALSNIEKIRTGKRTRIRPDTANRILGVGRSKAADGATVDAGPTWRLLDELIAHGYSRTYIATQLGSTAKRPALQVGRRYVTAATARQVAELHYRHLFRVIEQRRAKAERRAHYRQLERTA